MGLDMYLSARKYMSKYFDPADSDKIASINDLFGVDGDEENDYGAQEVIFKVAYWRKANAIHQWFVDNVQDGEDDCGEYRVSREQLDSLMKLCQDILKDEKLARELLPTKSGFFFGSTEYDDWYMGDVDHTAQRIGKILADPAFEKADFYYQSSW
jgi:hypothetical protein